MKKSEKFWFVIAVIFVAVVQCRFWSAGAYLCKTDNAVDAITFIIGIIQLMAIGAFIVYHTIDNIPRFNRWLDRL